MEARQNIRTYSIRKKFILYILLFSALVTLIGTAFQLYLEYRKDTQIIVLSLENIKKSHLQSLASNLWLFNEEVLLNQLEGILALPCIKYVHIDRNDASDFSVGQAPTTRIIKRSYPLFYAYRNQKIFLGTLHVMASLDSFYHRSIDRVLLILVVQFVEIFLVAIFIFYLFCQLVGRHLKKMSRHTTSLGIKNLENTLVLDRSTALKNKQKDELDQVVDSINTMQHQLYEAIRIHNQNESRLSQEVEERRKIQDAVDTSADGIILTDLDGKITYQNRAASIIYGYDKGELVGQDTNLLFVDAIARETIIPVTKEQGSWIGTNTALRKNDTTFPASVTTSLSVNEDGIPVGMLGVVRDITDIKEAEDKKTALEDQLHQAQKMESIGRLAGGVAHDFNNILCIINGHAEICLMRMEEDNPLREEMKIILESGARAARLTQQLLAFSRKQIIKPELLDLSAEVEAIQKMITFLLGENIEIKIIHNERVWPVKIDKSQIEQVILNLAVNARDAMPLGGRLTIEINDVTLDDNYVKEHLDITLGDYVMIAVSDTGHGMDKETQKHIFEPFYTTKDKDKGTGLGLATVHGIVKQNNGHISVYSQLDRGTTIRIYLPRSEVIGEELDRYDLSNKEQQLAQGKETILL